MVGSPTVLDSHPLVVCPTPGIDGILQGQAERIAESNYGAEARAGHSSDLNLAQCLWRDAGVTRDHLGVATGSGCPHQRAEALPGFHLLWAQRYTHHAGQHSRYLSTDTGTVVAV